MMDEMWNGNFVIRENLYNRRVDNSIKNEVYMMRLCAFRGEIKPEEANQKIF